MADFTELKQKHRATWAAGDYNQIAQGIQAAASRKDLTDLYRGYVTPADGKVRWGREYLITLATRA